MAAIAKIRIGVVKVPVSARPPGKQVFIYPVESGNRLHGVMQFDGIVDGMAIYTRVR